MCKAHILLQNYIIVNDVDLYFVNSNLLFILLSPFSYEHIREVNELIYVQCVHLTPWTYTNSESSEG